VLTWDGVRPIAELAGATARVLTTGGRWIDAPFRNFGVQQLWRVELSRNRQRKVLYATDGHRWLVRQGRYRGGEWTTAELRAGCELAYAFPQNRVQRLGDISPFGIAHGIAYGDGTRFNGFVAVRLVGEKDAQLVKWFPHSRTYAGTINRQPYTTVLDLPLHFKARPALDEAPTYLAGWLAGYLAADGHVSKDGTVMLHSARRDDLEFVRAVCTRLGVGTYGITEQVRLGLGRVPTSLYRVHLIPGDLDERLFLIEEHRRRFAARTNATERRGWVVRSVEPTDRVEDVYCATVPGTHAFALEDNILTGNCFGCQESGDTITFVQKIEHLDFVGAVEWLAGRADITLRYTDSGESETRKKRQRLHDAMEKAVDWYHQRLLTAPDGGRARGYLRARGFDGDTVRRYRLGWAPEAWDELVRALRLPEDVLVETGLGFHNRSGRPTDAFRGRVLFPIFDADGKAVAIGGRVLPGDEGPKYKNSPETALYSKSRVLYALNWHKGDIVKAGDRGEAIVCEGYTDVIGFAMAGVPRAVATCGTALTEEHVKLLSKFAKRIVLAFDADAAGQGAADRFAVWEQRYDLEVVVADLPSGSDPGDLAGRDPERLRAAVTRLDEWRPGTVGAKPYLAFRLDRVLAAADLRSVEGRARAATAGVDVLRDHPNVLVRDGYLMKLGDYCQIDADQLREQLRRGPRPAPDRSRPSRVTSPDDDRPNPEVEALVLLVQRRDEMLAWLDDCLFVDDRHLAVQRALVEHGDAGTALGVLRDTDPGAAEVLARVAVSDSDAEPDDVGARLIERATLRRLRPLEATARTAEDPLAYASEVAQLKLGVERLRERATRVEAAVELLSVLAAPPWR
jgi:DNA primase